MSPAARANPGFIALEGGDSRVEMVPEHGGHVRSLHSFGREWLFCGDDLAPKAGRAPQKGTGWDECAPSAGGGTMPDWVKGVGGLSLTVGGIARTQRPETTLVTDAEGHKVTCRWSGTQMPWTLERTVLVRPDGAVEARYEARNTGKERLPFLWSAWLTFPLSSRTRVKLPDGARLRVSALSGATVREGREVIAQWPRLMLDQRTRDLTTPWSVPAKTQLSAWVDLGQGRAVIQLIEDDERLTISCAGDGIPMCGVIVDRDGSQHTPRRRLLRPAKRTPTLSLVPALGAPERFSDALGNWQSITWLQPNEPRRWSMTIRGSST